jgi:26S proteasome regulatory subunit N6
MSTTSELLAEATKSVQTNPSHAESLYMQVLQTGKPSSQEQETALIKLGELYRDHKNADGVAKVITLSRSFTSSTAKAKTAKLSQLSLNSRRFS